MILLAAAGLLSMLAQVVILRELVAALFGVELLYVVALGAWLAGTAAGALLGRRAAGRRAVVAVAVLTLGALTLAELCFIRTAGALAGAGWHRRHGRAARDHRHGRWRRVCGDDTRTAG